MPCEHYKDALVEAAATGAEPQGELRAHLAACTSCRSALAEEKSLFASIDAGLHATANAEVPPSLLPRVRAALEEVSGPKHAWLSNGLALATAAAVILTLSISLVIRHRSSGRSVEPNVASTNPPTPLPPAQHVQTPGTAAKANSNFAYRPGGTVASNRAPRHTTAGQDNLPEVLVPLDQNVLLARYADEWSRRQRAPLLAEDSRAATLVPMQVAPIQIDQLDVKLLAEEKSQ
jgi:anti-sigma factor RsiW